MRGVIAYSGMTAKLHAMQSEFLTEEDYQKLSGYYYAAGKAEYLNEIKPYAGLFANMEENSLHRMDVERRLRLSEFRDFDKLYRFANARQRLFLRLYFGHFEVMLLRECLQAVLCGRPDRFRFALYEDFIKKYARLDLIRLSQSESIGQFIGALSGTPYYAFLKRLYDSGKAAPADYETAIDMRYFCALWEQKDKILSKDGRRIVEKTVGSLIDLTNMSWIYRAKKYFQIPQEELYALLIPVRYRLRAADLKRMAEAETQEAFLSAERQTCYGERMLSCFDEGSGIGTAIERLLDRMYQLTAQKYPYSIAPINTYFYRKEKEIARIIRIVESTHYEEDGLKKAVGEALS